MVKKLNPDDKAVWQKVASTVTPLSPEKLSPEKLTPEKLSAPEPDPSRPVKAKGKARKAKPKPANPSLTRAGETQKLKPPETPPGPANLNQQGYGGISRSDAHRIKSGQVEIDARIDLHGMTLERAMLRLRGFIASAIGRGDRTVLVITGKGRGGTGVIRQHLPVWLSEQPLKQHVIAFSEAQPKDGGSGAYYIRLRVSS